MTLSKHITNVQTLNGKDISSIPVDKVKDFIKKIKDRSGNSTRGLCAKCLQKLYDIIKEEAGDKLT